MSGPWAATVTVDLRGTRTFEIEVDSEEELEEIIEEINTVGDSDRAEMISEEVGPDGSGVTRW